MRWQKVLDELLEKAGPSIKYRIRRDILQEEIPADDDLYKAVLEDEHVQHAFSLQRDDGYFGDVFHSRFHPGRKYNGKIGAEGIIRFLLEKGIRNDDPRVQAGLKALFRENWLGQDKGIWCVYYKELGMYGPEFIRSVILAMAGIAGEELIPFVEETLKVFSGILDISVMDDIIEEFQSGGKTYHVYRKGICFPEIYHLKLLAFSDIWQRKKERAVVITGLKKLIHLSPLPEVKVKYKSRWLAPASLYPSNLKIDLNNLATKGWKNDNWAQWFHTFELFARMGIVNDIPELNHQAEQLINILENGKGFFTIKLPRDYFDKWSIYHGLALENNWSNGRDIYDLTFRSLFILNLIGLLG